MSIRYRYVDDLEGTIIKISKEQKITIQTPRGGTITTDNQGFELGQQVCFTVDSTNRIITILPKNIAKLTKFLGSDPILNMHILVDQIEEEQIIEGEEIAEDETTEILDEEEESNDNEFRISDEHDVTNGN